MSRINIKLNMEELLKRYINRNRYIMFKDTIYKKVVCKVK